MLLLFLEEVVGWMVSLSSWAEAKLSLLLFVIESESGADRSGMGVLVVVTNARHMDGNPKLKNVIGQSIRGVEP